MDENELPFIDDAEIFSAELRRLYAERNSSKISDRKPRKQINKSDKLNIFQKTAGNCHICGQKLNENTFQIDHLLPHSFGGTCELENFIPVCNFCNNYRWNYLPDEIKWIMKIGIWAKTQIEFETSIGKLISEQFIQYEKNRESRRKNKREPLFIDKEKFPIREKIDFTILQKNSGK